MAGILNAQNNIAASFPALDQYGPNTTLLLHGDGTNGAQNNTFLDSSANNFTITRNGNTTQGTFSPFSQPNGWWSNYLNGSSYLTSAVSSNLALGSSDFTVEYWVYFPSLAGAFSNLTFGNGGTGGIEALFGWYQVSSTGGQLALFLSSNGSSYDVASNVTLIPAYPALGVWHHVAVTRSGSTFRTFWNGSQQATFTSSASLYQNTNQITVGRGQGSYYPNAYISNVRFVKGTSLYNSNFTPSTTPLTAVTNTQYLTCQSNRFVDNSTNAFAITPSGTPSVQAFKPFSAPTAYYPAVNGGAGYFDGSGDYLATPTTSQPTASGDFTISCWFYLQSFGANYYAVGGNWTSGISGEWLIQIQNNGTIRFLTTADGTFAGTVRLNEWTYFSASRSGTTVTVQLNGSTIRTYTLTGTLGVANETINIGQQVGNNWPWNGYIADFNFNTTTATTAVPTAPASVVSGTSLLLKFQNAGIIDSVSQNQLETVGNAQVSTTQSKFGGASMYFDGASSVNGTSEYPYISGTGDFTAEFWVYPSSLASYNQILATTSSGGFGVLINSNGTISYTQVGVAVLGTSANSVASGVWSHVAVARSSGVIRIFVNGNQGYSGSDTTNFSAYPIKVGRDANASSPYTGYVDDLRITKGIARYTQNFTPPQKAYPDYGPLTNIQTVDPNFKNTTLLLHGNGTNGAQNNTFLDSSTNNFTITRNGNTTQGTFTPFSQPNGWWSNYFGGSQSINAPASTDFQFVGDFTIEAWLYPTSTGDRSVIVQNSGSNYLALNVNAGTGFNIYLNSSGPSISPTDIIPQVNQWNHVALVRSGSTVRVYLNGVASGTTATNSSTVGYNLAFYVGALGTQSSGSTIGYISNVRVVNGTAVYTSNFTPPTSSLTAITNTKLLTCQSNRFLDNSSNAFAITTSGTPTVQNFYPFFPPLDYSTAAIGGSAYFDGSGDYLSAGSNAAFAFGTGAYTVEMWVNPSSISQQVYLFNDTTGGSGFYFETSGSAGFTIAPRATGSPLVTGGYSSLQANAWNHVVFCRASTSSNQTSIFVNGTRVANGTDNTNWTVNGPCLVGGLAANIYMFAGHMSQVRVVKGTDVYGYSNTSITVPTTPLTAITNTSLLLSCTNAGIFDNASKNDLETVGNAQISTTQSKFGGSSMYFNGTTDYLKLPNNPALGMGSGDFTIEAWIYPTTVSATYQGIFSTTGTSSSDIQVQLNNNLLRFTSYTAQIAITTSTISANQWTHIAVCRFGGTTYLYINGNLGGSGTDSTNWVANPANIGAIFNSSYPFSGYMDDFRITNGFARYRYNFTPPAAQFPNK